MAEEFTEANRAYFNDLAHRYDTKPWQTKMISQVTAEIRAKLDFINADWATDKDHDGPRQVRLLDYACGTGTVSRALGPYINRTLGIDIAESMVSVYNNTARSSNLPTTVAHAIIGNLLSPNPSDQPKPSPADGITEADLYNFDIAAIGLGFHHFHDHEGAIAKLAERLRPGGVLLIIDFTEERKGGFARDHKFVGQHTVKTFGFSEAQMKELFEDQGLCDVGYSVMDQPVTLRMDEANPVTTRIFLGRATKP